MVNTIETALNSAAFGTGFPSLAPITDRCYSRAKISTRLARRSFRVDVFSVRIYSSAQAMANPC